jgi:hypothetical protein
MSTSACGNCAEYVVGFFDEDGQQFCVDLSVGCRRGRSHRRGGDARRGFRRRGQLRFGIADLDRFLEIKFEREFGFGRSLALFGCQEVVQVGLSVLERTDEETQCRKRVGKLVELLLVGLPGAFGQFCDPPGGILHQRQCLLAADDGQRALDLPQRPVQLRKGCALAVIAEKIVERLLDVTEVRGDLVGDLLACVPFVCAADSVE